MSTLTPQQAFIAGFEKRAEELGLHKEAFMPFLMHSVFPLASTLAADMYARKGLKALAARKLASGKRPLFGSTAKKITDKLEAQNMTGVMANTGLMLGTGMAVSPITERIANKLSPIKAEEPRPYNPHYVYPQ